MLKEAEKINDLERIKEIINLAVANKNIVRIKTENWNRVVRAVSIQNDKYFVFKNDDDPQEQEEILSAIIEVEILGN